MDPIADLITRIKNAGNAKKEIVLVPYSNVKGAIAALLKTKGFVKDVKEKTKKQFKFLEIEILYNQDQTPKIRDIKRVSKPSRRVYIGFKEIRPFKQGYGMRFLSTPKGILEDKQARSQKVGGEVLFEIW